MGAPLAMAVRITPDISLKPAGIAVGLPIKSRRITGTTNPRLYDR